MLDVERLHLCRDALIARVQSDGGWGLRRTQFSSISNTAEAIAVLRTANVPLHHPIVVGGLDYLAEAIEVHPKAKEKGGRNPHTRYAAHALRGFSEYPHSLFEKRYMDGFFTAWNWLKENNTAGDGWTEWPTHSHLSMFSTANVAIALQRSGIPKLRQRLARIRRAVRMEGKTGSKGVSWKQRPGDQGACPAATAWAVLALSGSMEEEDLEMASAGIRWLLMHRDRWQATPIEDRNVEGASWKHVTPALGLKAVLCGAGEIRPDNHRLKAAWEFLDKLWLPDRREWGPDVGSNESMAGNYAVATVYETWIDQWRQGPNEARPVLSLDQPLQLAVIEDAFFLVEDGKAWDKPVHLGPRVKWMLGIIVERAAEGKVVSESELRDLAPEVKDKSAFRHYCDRINKNFAKHSGGRVPLTVNRDVMDGPPVYSLEIPLSSAPDLR